MKVHGSFVILDINNKRCTDARNIFKVDIGKTSSPHDCSGPQVLRCCIMNYGSVHISHIWCVIFWRGDRQCFLPCGPVTFQYMFYFWLISVCEAGRPVFVFLMISHHLQVKLNHSSRQDRLLSLTMWRNNQIQRPDWLRPKKKLLIANTRSSVIFSKVHKTKTFFHTFLCFCLIESSVIMWSVSWE